MTLRQQRAKKPTDFERRAFDTAHTILEGSGLRYQSAQIDGLATVLAAYAQREIELSAASREQPSEPPQKEPK